MEVDADVENNPYTIYTFWEYKVIEGYLNGEHYKFNTNTFSKRYVEIKKKPNKELREALETWKLMQM